MKHLTAQMKNCPSTVVTFRDIVLGLILILDLVNWLYPDSKVAEHLTHNLKFEDLNPVACTVKIFLTIVSDSRKLRLYYKCFISPSLSLS